MKIFVRYYKRFRHRGSEFNRLTAARQNEPSSILIPSSKGEFYLCLVSCEQFDVLLISKEFEREPPFSVAPDLAQRSFQVTNQMYGAGSVIIPINKPFDGWS